MQIHLFQTKNSPYFSKKKSSSYFVRGDEISKDVPKRVSKGIDASY